MGVGSREYPEWLNGIKCESIFAIPLMNGTIPLPFNSLMALLSSHSSHSGINEWQGGLLSRFLSLCHADP